MINENPTLGEMIEELAQRSLDRFTGEIRSPGAFLANSRKMIADDEDQHPGATARRYAREVANPETDHAEMTEARQLALALSLARDCVVRGFTDAQTLLILTDDETEPDIARRALALARSGAYTIEGPKRTGPSVGLPAGEPVPAPPEIDSSNETISLTEYLERHPEHIDAWKRIGYLPDTHKRTGQLAHIATSDALPDDEDYEW